MNTSTSCCQICEKLSNNLFTCSNCKFRYYCSQDCEKKDKDHLCEELKNEYSQIPEEKKQNAALLIKRFNETYMLLGNEFLRWKTTESYKTSILSEYFVIYFNDDKTIITTILPLENNAGLNWLNINCKRSIPILLCNKIGNASLTVNFPENF